MLDVSTTWCGRCRELAADVELVQQEYDEYGFVYITILLENDYSQIPTIEELQEWGETYQIVSAPILTPEQDYRHILAPTGSYPRLIVLDKSLQVQNDNIFPHEPVVIAEQVESNL